MKKKVLLISLLSLCVIFSSVQVYAQRQPAKDDPVAKLPFKKKLKYADALFKERSYYTAEEYYFQLLKEDPRNPYVNYQLAQSLRFNRDYALASKYYREAYELASAIYVRAPYYEGIMRKMNGEYDEAISRFNEFKKIYKGKDRRQFLKLVDKEIAGCQMAMKSILNPERAFVKNCGPNVNSAYTDYNPVPLGDTALLFATMNQNKIVYKGKDRREDYYSRFRWSPKEFDRTKVKDSFEVAMPFNDGAGRFNEKGKHIGNGNWSPGGDRFYYTKCAERDSMKTICEIWVSEFDRKRGLWGKSKKVEELNFETEADGHEVSSTNPYVAFIGKKEVIFFSSDRKMQGAGGFDIWYSVYDSTREEARRYRRAQNCGKRVNTPKDEITPYYDSRHGLLYWSSNGLVGVGGFDVYKAEGGPSRYYNVQNLGFPINSPQDDMYYIEDDNPKQNGYVVSNRMGSYFVKNPTCCDDIWRVIKEPNFYVRGQVVDENTQEIIGQAVIKMKNESKDVIQDTFFSKTGKFLFYTPIGNNYSLSADKEGYISGRTIVNTAGKSVMDPDDTTTVTIYMQRIGSNTEFHVQNVYYNFDKGNFQPEPSSYAALDSMVNFMKDNPSISVEIRSHTDKLGTDAYNKELSLKRAQAVLDYLVSKGVDRSRMIARGMGETAPIKSGNDYVDRQWNRRTEFRIIGDVPGMRIYYDQNRPEYFDKSGSDARRSNLNVPEDPEDPEGDAPVNTEE